MSGIVSDQTIRLTGSVTAKRYPVDLHMMRFHDAVNDEVISFIINNLELWPLVIANIYSSRWSIEIFFKWIKGNLTIKSLRWLLGERRRDPSLGRVCSYLLLAWVKAALGSPLTITEVAKVVEVHILSKADLKTIMDVPRSLTLNQDVYELELKF